MCLGGENNCRTKNKLQKGKSINNEQGSGSQYHREHASNVPDYGANNIDPNAKGLSNMTDNNTEQ